MKQFILILLTSLLAVAPCEARRSKSPKKVNTEVQPGKEFRGTWIQTAFQDRYARMNPQQMKQYLTQLVDGLCADGFNAVLFQVRPEGDAFYRSSLEPWSRFLTGRQGLAPADGFDPMAFMIDLCHRRHIEFHAWINPYRMSATKSLQMAEGHLYSRHPEWFVKYEDKLYLNPGMPECRSYVREVVKDIVGRYDIDALHIDDYFYPYPVAGKEFPDRATFNAYAQPMGFDVNQPADWGNFRRRCVDILIKGIHDDIRALKPWVRFGVSPFGIYRNQRSWEGGSQTNGTQCYDDLYADVLLWAQNGWIDYVIPQLYWEIGHKAADYSTLVEWWNQAIPTSCHLYIGQSIERSLDTNDAKQKPKEDLRHRHDHLMRKLTQAAACDRVRGHCFWYAYQIGGNEFHVADFLRDSLFHAAPVVPPAFTMLDAEAPAKVREMKAELTEKGLHLSWAVTPTDDPMQRPSFYCVYKFAKGEKVDLTVPGHVILKTLATEFFDQNIAGGNKYTYVVTAVDLCNNESAPVRKSFKVKHWKE